MNLSKPALIAILAAIPSSSRAQCPETGQLNECELALYETATVLDGQNKESATLLNACHAKLLIRTSTSVRSIVAPCPMLEEKEEPWAIYAVTLTASIMIGFLSGLLMR